MEAAREVFSVCGPYTPQRASPDYKAEVTHHLNLFRRFATETEKKETKERSCILKEK